MIDLEAFQPEKLRNNLVSGLSRHILFDKFTYGVIQDEAEADVDRSTGLNWKDDDGFVYENMFETFSQVIRYDERPVPLESRVMLAIDRIVWSMIYSFVYGYPSVGKLGGLLSYLHKNNYIESNRKDFGIVQIKNVLDRLQKEFPEHRFVIYFGFDIGHWYGDWLVDSFLGDFEGYPCSFIPKHSILIIPDGHISILEKDCLSLSWIPNVTRDENAGQFYKMVGNFSLVFQPKTCAFFYVRDAV